MLCVASVASVIRPNVPSEPTITPARSIEFSPTTSARLYPQRFSGLLGCWLRMTSVEAAKIAERRLISSRLRGLLSMLTPETIGSRPNSITCPSAITT